MADYLITAAQKTERENAKIMQLELQKWGLVLDRRAERAAVASNADQTEKDASAAKVAGYTQQIKSIQRQLDALMAQRGVDDSATAPAP